MVGLTLLYVTGTLSCFGRLIIVKMLFLFMAERLTVDSSHLFSDSVNREIYESQKDTG